MKVGDLIYIPADDTCEGMEPISSRSCFCFFCAHGSSRIGIVIERLNKEGVKHSGGYWSAVFDAGEWRVYGTEAEVINYE